MSGPPGDAPLPKLSLVREWGRMGTANGEFRFPIGVAIDASDTLYVTDFRNGRIQRFDGDGKFLSAFPTITRRTPAAPPRALALLGMPGGDCRRS